MTVNLADNQALQGIIPVYSAPITVKASRNKLTSTRKLDEIQRVFQLPVCSPGDPGRIMRFTEKTAFDLDKVSGN